MTPSPLQKMIDTVPPGAWAVGVSGGADSVALLRLLCDRADLRLVVVHLDHETRGGASTQDAAFVERLAAELNRPAVVARRSEIEPQLARLPRNQSARYRAARLALFAQVVRDQRLLGVILAHHADDQAETVLQRLLRGAPAAGLAGMSPSATVGGLRILRPLLSANCTALRALLEARGQAHREDASNASDDYQRNRVRKLLADRPGLRTALLDLARAGAAWRDWVIATAPELPERFAIARLADLPDPLARESAKRWLVARGAPADGLTGGAVDRLIAMCADASTASRGQFPGGLTVRRRRGVVERLAFDTMRRYEP
jgi:tRNA(Ile)-lysidine synthase